MASAAVVLAVGTRFSGHASSATLQSSATSAACASVDVGRAGDRHELRAEAPNRLEQPENFVGFAAVGQRHDDIVVLDDAEVAVNRFGRMQKERRRADARQRRRNLAADDARLAHAGQDDAAAAFAQELDGALESLVEAVDQREDRRRFGFEDFAGEREVTH